MGDRRTREAMGKGCGGDGGTTNATRAELVKLKKAPERIERDTVNAMRWTLCALSQDALADPVVVDYMGNLYNKSEVLKYLLSKQPQPKFAHIKTLKDVWNARLTYADDHKRANASATDAASAAAPAAAAPAAAARAKDAAHLTGAERAMSGSGGRLFVCPVTDLPGSGRYPFVAKMLCGCVHARKALTEVPSDACLVCGRALPSDPKLRELESLPLLPDSMAELDRLRAAIPDRKAHAAAVAAAAKSGAGAAKPGAAKAAKPKASKSAAAAAAAAAGTDASGSSSGSGKSDAKATSSSAGAVGAATAAPAAASSSSASSAVAGKKRKADGPAAAAGESKAAAAANAKSDTTAGGGKPAAAKADPKADADTAKRLKSLHPAFAQRTVSAAADADAAVAAQAANSAAYRSLFIPKDQKNAKAPQNSFISTKGANTYISYY